MDLGTEAFIRINIPKRFETFVMILPFCFSHRSCSSTIIPNALVSFTCAASFCVSLDLYV